MHELVSLDTRVKSEITTITTLLLLPQQQQSGHSSIEQVAAAGERVEELFPSYISKYTNPTIVVLYATWGIDPTQPEVGIIFFVSPAKTK